MGVDPVEGGTHKMTSDEFFNINKDMFDIMSAENYMESNNSKNKLRLEWRCVESNCKM